MWHVENNGQARGPYTDDQLKALCETNAVRSNTLVWKMGFAGWKPLSETDFQYLGSATTGLAPGAGSGGTFDDEQSASPFPNLVPPENLSMWRYFLRSISSRYVQFKGRATRKDYWSFVMFYYLSLFVAFAAGLGIDWALGNLAQAENQHGPFAAVVGVVVVVLGLALPHLSALVRRLHDVGLSGFLALLLLIPYLGAIVVFVLTLLKSDPKGNTHGPATSRPV